MRNRIKILKEIDEIYLSESDCNHIVQIVETKKIKNEADLEKQYTRYISSDYEGMMIRFANGQYTTSSTGTAGLRSKDLLKKKEIFTDEFELVGFEETFKGVANGSFVYICQNENGLQFKVTPKIPFDKRRIILKDMKNNFQDKYANRWLTIEYRGLTENNIPGHAVAIDFRDSE